MKFLSEAKNTAKKLFFNKTLRPIGKVIFLPFLALGFFVYIIYKISFNFEQER